MDLQQFDELLHDAEVKLKRLKALYEQWFQGIERLEPLIPRKDLDRTLMLLNKEKPRNTAVRFRLQQLVARYAIYTTYWQRIARQIEEGTFVRDVRRAHQLQTGPKGRAKAFEVDLDEEIDVSDVESDELADMLSALPAQTAPKPAAKAAFSVFSPFAKKAEKPAEPQPAVQPPVPNAKPAAAQQPKPAPKPAAPAPPPPAQPNMRKTIDAAPLELLLDGDPLPPPRQAPQAKPPEPPKPEPPNAESPAPPKESSSATFKKPAQTFGKPKAPAPAGPPKDELRHLYDQFVAARRRNNETAGDVGYEKMADSVEKLRAKLRERHGDKKIDFEVVTENGKVSLKPKIG
jgi:outer membrane biosynthesis protein TonB